MKRQTMALLAVITVTALLLSGCAQKPPATTGGYESKGKELKPAVETPTGSAAEAATELDEDMQTLEAALNGLEESSLVEDFPVDESAFD